MIKPAEIIALQVDDGMFAKVAVADQASGGIGVAPGTDGQLLVSMLETCHFQIVQLRANTVAIEPAGLVEDWNIHVLQAVQKICRTPIVVVGRMLDPLAPIQVLLAQHGLIKIDHRQRAQQFGVFLFRNLA